MTSDGWTYYRPVREGARPEGVHEADPGCIVEYRSHPVSPWRRSPVLGWLPSVEYRYRLDGTTARRCGGKKCGLVACDDCCPKLAEQQLPLPVELPENPKAIYGRAKPSLGLFPSAALIECAGVFQSGADKYGLANWRKDPVESMTYVHAALRHIFKWVDGQDYDEESEYHELAHAIACLAILIDAEWVNRLIDDRPHEGRAADHLSHRTQPIT